MNEENVQGDFATLYAYAFDMYGARALWSRRRLDDPTPADTLGVARILRIEGDLAARRLTEEREAACLAAH